MKELIEQLKRHRINLDESKTKYNKELEEFKLGHSNILADIEQNNTDIIELTVKIKAEAVEEYNETGITKFDCGVKIIQKKTMTYDAEKALKWAITHEMALSLDKKRFEQLAKMENISKTDNLDFVEISEIATATIPAKL